MQGLFTRGPAGLMGRGRVGGAGAPRLRAAASGDEAPPASAKELRGHHNLLPSPHGRALSARAALPPTAAVAAPPAPPASAAQPTGDATDASSAALPTARAARKPLHVRINDEWYDLSGWRLAHPGVSPARGAVRIGARRVA
jgi:hypothetical protein